jgi:hypothetical protein
MSAMELLVDGHHGVYVPQVFAETVNLQQFSGIRDEDLQTVLTGPDANAYYDAWANILDSAELIDHQGHRWLLHQDGDIWMYCPELMSELERETFFG